MSSTELAVISPAQSQPAALPVRMPGPRLALPSQEEMTALQTYGEVVVKSGLAPKHISTWQAAVVTMRYGHQIGVDEFTALQHIYLINGRPSADASLLHSMIIRDHGDNAIIPTEMNATRVALKCRRRGSNEAIEVSYSIEEATVAGLTGDNWKKYPQDMLFARAISRAGRVVFRDSTHGMYVPEEIGVNVIEVNGEIIDGRSQVRNVPPPIGDPVEVQSAPVDAKAKANARFHAVGAEHGWTDEALHLLAVATFPKRTSRSQLTADELNALAEHLALGEQMVDGEGNSIATPIIELANAIAAAPDQKTLADIAAKIKDGGLDTDGLRAMWKTRNRQVPAAPDSGQPELIGAGAGSSHFAN